MASEKAAVVESPLTAAKERRFVLCQRLVAIVQFPGWTFTLPYVADTRHYMRMCNGDIATMAISRGTTEALTALCGGLLAPVFGSLSDAIGRRPVQIFAGCGALLRCVLIPLTTTLRTRMLVDILCKGVIEAGMKTVKGATHSDVFGTRPDRSGAVRATEDMYSQLLSILSPSFAEVLARFLGDNATFVAGGAAAALGVVATVACPETLPKGNRRQFELKRANPVSGLWVLLSHGRRLRQLTVATALNRLAVNVNVMMLESFRLGTFGWVPLDLSRYKQSVAWIHGLAQGIMIPKIISRYGNRGAGEIAATVLGFGIIAWGNVYRCFPGRLAFGLTPFLVVYTLTQLVGHNTWEAICKFTLQFEIVEEGLRATNWGKGELNAAYEGLDLLVQVIMPPVSGWLLAEFQNPRRLPMWLRWGGQPNNGGGLYVVGGVLCLTSAVMLWTVPRSNCSAVAETEHDDVVRDTSKRAK